MTQRIASGRESTNTQIAVQNNYGASYEDMKAIANDIFRANFVELQGQAMEVALERADWLVERVLDAIKRIDPTLVEAIKDPDVQYSLFVAQREYAKSGSEDVGHTLIGLLADRFSSDNQSLRALVLNEAIGVVARLTNRQIEFLTLQWLATNVTHPDVTNLDDLVARIESNWLPMMGHARRHDTIYRHLEYLGCITRSEMISINFSSLFTQIYPGIFCRGFQEDEIPVGLRGLSGLFVPCPRGGVQIDAVRIDEFINTGRSASLTADQIDQISSLLTNYTLQPDEVADMIIDRIPSLASMKAEWEQTAMRVSLTTVGTAIAYANWRRYTNNSQADLAIWIPD